MKKKRFIKIPIIGTLTAHEPYDKMAQSSTHLALKVKGDNMLEVGIFDGDIVIVKNN